MTSLKLDSRFSGHNTKVWTIASVVSLITILVYLPALQNKFVNWDDNDYIYENPYIQSIGLEFFKWMFTTFHASNWHPLTWLSHTTDYAIWGLNPMGHHLTSIIFHGLNTFLVVLIIIRLINCVKYKSLSPTPPDRRLASPFIPGIAPQSGAGKGGGHTPTPCPTDSRWALSRGGYTPIIAGAVTGLLFGLHPLHVESVAWVSERKDVLYAFFFLLSILSYLKYASSNLYKQKTIYYSLCLLFFILSLMSKPMAVTLPVVLLILDIYPLERLKIKSAFTSQRKVLIEKIPFLGLSLASSVMTVMAQQTQKAIVPLWAHSFGDRLLIAIKALCFYLFKMIWPTELAPLYPFPINMSLNLEYIGSFLLNELPCGRDRRVSRLKTALFVSTPLLVFPVLVYIFLLFPSLPFPQPLLHSIHQSKTLLPIILSLPVASS